MRELSISRKSASIRSLSSGAKICKKDTQPVLLPTPKLLPVLNSKALGAMKSFTDSPEGASQSHEKRKGCGSSMWSIPCSRRRRSIPFRLSAITPRRRKLLRISVSMRSNRGFAAFRLSASTPKVRYLVLISPLFPLASWLCSIPVYSLRSLSKQSPCKGMAMRRA